MAYQNAKEYEDFVKVYKELYPAIKKVSPATNVFVSFQWDFMYILGRKEPQNRAEHKKTIDAFRPELDLVALSSYPQTHFRDVSAIPRDYYSKVRGLVSQKDQIMFLEIGWPGPDDAFNRDQSIFVNELPRLMAEVKPKFLFWSLLHDVKSAVIDKSLASTGLLKIDGHEKPAYKSFIELKKK